MTPLAAYVLLFLAVGIGFIFVHLLVGKLIRPSRHHPEKGTIYECGEPTIGSAWIQFDLRFYVVALLFVIFDVEVAFFFPWAEVFGKANAIVNAPEPKTAEQYRSLAEKVRDLAVARAEPQPGIPQRTQTWERLSKVTPEEVAAWKALKPKEGQESTSDSLMTYLLGMTAPVYEQAAQLDSKQVALLTEHSKTLNDKFKKMRNEQEAAMKKLVAALEKLPEATRKKLEIGDLEPLKAEPRQRERTGVTKTLDELRTVDKEAMSLLNSVSPNVREVLPEDLRRELTELGGKQGAELREVAGQVLASLNKVGPEQKELWSSLSPASMAALGALDPEQKEALSAISRPMLATLDGALVQETRLQARSLARTALVEIIVFFGVLLVGFAYLWLRGDLAWVRSLAAEQVPVTTNGIPPGFPVTSVKTMEVEITSKT